MTYLSAVLADAPLHYWRCADPGGAILVDIGSPSPKHMHAVINAAVGVSGFTLGYSGPNSDGGAFDGCLTNLYANTGTAVAFPAGALSCEMLVWPFQNLVSAGTLLNFANGANVFGLIRNGTQWSAQYNNTNAASATGYSAEAWRHLVMTYDGVSVRLYVDGTQAAIAAVGASGAFNSLVTLGSNATFANWGQSMYSEVAIYGSTLSAARVSAHFASLDQVTNFPTYKQNGVPPTNGGGGQPTADALAAILGSVRKTY